MRIPRASSLALLALLAASAAACSTKRYFVIRSDPPGANVWVNGVYAGVAPVTHPFVYYGEFDVRLEKPGYESLAGPVTVPTQPDGYPIVDLPQEWIVRERRFEWTGHLRRLPPRVSEESAREVYDRAKTFRERTKTEATESGTPGKIPRGFPWDEPLPPPPPIPPFSRSP